MFRTDRPAGRIFYLVMTMVVAATSSRLYAAPQSGPALTSVVEVRENDYGWGQANDRNLLGRFSSQSFNLARLQQTQDYFLRLYDGSSPPRYSRYSAALHVDYPL
jgi:hypothetical protein